MNATRAPNTEPIPGYRLIEPLGSGGFGEVWKCEAPGGLFKAVKFVRGETEDLLHHSPAGAQQELRALQHVKSVRHPFLLSLDRVEVVNGELVIVMELADRSLHDLLVECRAAGRQGVQRAELLRYFAEAAEVLDLLNLEHGLQHLDVKPRNLFLVGRHVKVADFGLVSSLAEWSGNTPNALQIGGATPLYAAPENFLGKVTLYSDQYSLAIAYHELLVGEPPFTGKNVRQLALQHLQVEPDLSLLPACDRPAAARALAKEPSRRFPSCSAFVEALLTGDVGAPMGPPSSAPGRPKPPTCTDLPVVSLETTPVAAYRVDSEKVTRPEVSQETREFPTPAGPGSPLALAGPPAAAPAPAAKAAVHETLPPSATRPAQSFPAAPAGDDPLARLQFLECLIRNPYGETWTARTADGRDRLVRLVFGLGADARREGEALARLRDLKHPALEPMELVGGGEHRLAVIADASHPTLAARLQEHRVLGDPGLPRADLLALLGEAAEALDALAEAHGVRHLGLNPRQLTARDGHVGILHFGLVELLQAPAGHSPGALNPRYAAPELFEGRVHASSDVYSLALIYYELLTGSHPFRSLSQRQVTMARHRAAPDLGLAPAPDREVLLRALDTDPDRRPATCGELIAALDEAGRPAAARAAGSVVVAGPDVSVTPATRSLMRRAINGLVAEAAGDQEVRERGAVRYLVRPGRGLEHQFFARLPTGVARVRLMGFHEQYNVQEQLADGRRFRYLLPLPGGAWQRLMGAKPGLRIDVETTPPAAGGATLTQVKVRIEPVHCKGAEAVRALDDMGPRLLEGLRTILQAMPERRSQTRLRYEHPVHVSPVMGDQTVGEAILSQAKDISLRGMGLMMPCRPPSMLLQIRLPGESPTGEVDVPACIVRAAPQGNGRYDVGVRFLLEDAGFVEEQNG